MLFPLIITTFTVYMHIQQCFGLKLIDLTSSDTALIKRKDLYDYYEKDVSIIYASIKPPIKKKDNRRFWLVTNEPFVWQKDESKTSSTKDDKDDTLKEKIATLVEQTLHDTERKIKSVEELKKKYRELAPYKTGFILSMVKKSRDVLNELFNVAVKHKEEWKALEQLKIFELVVHTNVDTTNLVRQMVEIHIQHVNSTTMSKSDNKVVLF